MPTKVEGWRGADGVVYDSEAMATSGEQKWAIERLAMTAGEAWKAPGTTFEWFISLPEIATIVRDVLLPALPPLAVAHALRAKNAPIGRDEFNEALAATSVKAEFRRFDVHDGELRSIEILDTLPETLAEAAAIDPTRVRPEYTRPTWVNDDVGGVAYAPNSAATEAERAEYVHNVHQARRDRSYGVQRSLSDGELPMSQVPGSFNGQTIDDDERATLAAFSKG